MMKIDAFSSFPINRNSQLFIWHCFALLQKDSINSTRALIKKLSALPQKKHLVEKSKDDTKIDISHNKNYLKTQKYILYLLQRHA